MEIKDKTVEKIFGGQRVIGADANVLNSLAALGPWGLALIAAYLAGQGLVQLAEKVQMMRAPGSSAASLTPEEFGRVQEAIQVMESEQFAKTYPISDSERLKIEIDVLGHEVSEAMVSPPPPPTDRCQYLKRLERRIRVLFFKARQLSPVVLLETHHMIDMDYGWQYAIWTLEKGIERLHELWGCDDYSDAGI